MHVLKEKGSYILPLYPKIRRKAFCQLREESAPSFPFQPPLLAYKGRCMCNVFMRYRLELNGKATKERLPEVVMDVIMNNHS